MSAALQLNESNLMRGIVHGPLTNSRFRHHLELNILGDEAKVCSFDCGYCHLGATHLRLNKVKHEVSFPSPEDIGQELAQVLTRLQTEGIALDRICISGNGEPTLHPEFVKVIQNVLSVRDTHYPGLAVAVLTNGALLDNRKISDALNSVDERIVKIDAGNEKLFKAMNAPLSRASLARVLVGIQSLKDVIVQSLFTQGVVDNTGLPHLDDWMEAVAMVRPKAVHIHTLSLPGVTPGLKACDEDTLYTIASRLERKTQIKAFVTL